jgi:hypothetical protein
MLINAGSECISQSESKVHSMYTTFSILTCSLLVGSKQTNQCLALTKTVKESRAMGEAT